MYYRIHFEPKGGYWCIQFQSGFLFWKTVQATVPSAEGGPVETTTVLKFKNLREAEEYAAATGIDSAYHRTCTKTTRSAVAASAQHA